MTEDEFSGWFAAVTAEFGIRLEAEDQQQLKASAKELLDIARRLRAASLPSAPE